MATGFVSLIGAGPGDPDLITVLGRRRLEQCDVVIYDRLAHPSLLHYCRPDCERIYAGKSGVHHALKQSEINELLVDRAGKGLRVARLKGGDPFVFGRGGEEAEFCREAGVAFEVVPGVTSAIAAAAYAGIPVTHRDAASSFAVITGHERAETGESALRAPGQAEQRRNWAHIAHAADTLVFLMGVEALPEITARLIENGRDPLTPVALVQWGTWPQQRVVTGTLETIQAVAADAKLTPPAVCVVGEVVRLRDKLRWFDLPGMRPLAGKRILVTRAREQASALSDMLREKGAEPIEFPTICIEPLADYTELDARLQDLASYRWVIFTSVNGVDAVARRLVALQLDSRLFHGVGVAAIGPATAAALLAKLAIRADFVPEEAVSEAIVAQWPDSDLSGRRVLIPRAEEARDLLPTELAKAGATVDVTAAYRTVLAGDNFDTDGAGRGGIDVITFTSSSTVRNYVQALEASGQSLRAALGTGALVAAIGPITAETATSLGLKPDVVAPVHTIPGLVDAICTYFNEEATSTGGAQGDA